MIYAVLIHELTEVLVLLRTPGPPLRDGPFVVIVDRIIETHHEVLFGPLGRRGAALPAHGSHRQSREGVRPAPTGF